jgi:hypothetical protein
VVHPTYKHLEAKLRLGAFSLGQWAQIGLAGVLAAVFGVYVSPLPSTVTIFVSIVGAGLPVAVSYGAMGLDFSVGQFVGSAWRYWRSPRQYLPGAGTTAVGYVVEPTPAADASEVRPQRPSAGSGATTEGLWDV